MPTKAVAGTRALYSEKPEIIFWIVDGHFPTGENENELVVLTDKEVEHLRNRLDCPIPEKRDYEHYKKRNLYTVRGIVRNPETNDVFVWYQAKYYSAFFGDECNWVRPIEMFLEQIDTFVYHGTRYIPL